MMKNVGYAGTWGPGANAMNNIHVKDCAMGLLFVLQAALEGRADEGLEGLCKRNWCLRRLPTLTSVILKTLRQVWSLESRTTNGQKLWAT